ncbi:MAG TPA: hypothetical protein VFM18_00495 [Methanosarcina sp.]|nr:hypothetical protein [Methanosarcina sp.]
MSTPELIEKAHSMSSAELLEGSKKAFGNIFQNLSKEHLEKMYALLTSADLALDPRETEDENLFQANAASRRLMASALSTNIGLTIAWTSFMITLAKAGIDVPNEDISFFDDKMEEVKVKLTEIGPVYMGEILKKMLTMAMGLEDEDKKQSAEEMLKETQETVEGIAKKMTGEKILH